MRKISQHRWYILVLLLLGSSATAEHQIFGDGFEDESRPVIARIEVLPGGALFTQVDESRLLLAVVYDDNDHPLSDVELVWTSNDGATVSVDSNGLITANVDLGSAQITASVGGVNSPPVTVLIAQPLDGAIMIDDEEVLESPDLVDPNADLELGLQLVTTLDDTSTIQVGDVIVGTGVEPIGGLVTEIITLADGSQQVTYELLPLDELFAKFLLDETYDLTKVPSSMGENAANFYTLRDLGNGAVRLTQKPMIDGVFLPFRQSSIDVTQNAKFMIGPFECEATSEPPFSITTNPGTIDLTTNATLSVLFAVPIPTISEFELARLDGEIRAKFEAELTVDTQFEAQVKCEALGLIEKTIPIPGPAIVFSPTVRLGPTIALGGTIETQSLSIKLNASAGALGFVEIRCPPGNLTKCKVNAEFDAPDPKAEYEITIPDPATAGNAKIKPELSAGIAGNVSFGLPRSLTKIAKALKKLRLDAAKASFGLKQTGDLALVKTQINDDVYESNYKLAYVWEAGAGADIESFLNYLSRLPGVDIPTSTSGKGDLAVSPTAIKAEADVNFFRNGDTVTFTVDLDTNSMEYPFIGYNVEKIKIYRKTFSSNIDQIADVSATAGQSSFIIPWVSDANGSITEEEYFAFVSTNALPVPYIGDLELSDISLQMCTDGAPTCSFTRSAVYDANAEPVSPPQRLFSGDFIIVGLSGHSEDVGDGRDEFTRWIYDYRSDLDTINQLDPDKLITAELNMSFDGGGGNDDTGIHGLDQIPAFPNGVDTPQTYNLLTIYSGADIISKINAVQSSSSTNVTAFEGELLMGYQDDAIVRSATLKLVFEQACPIVCPSSN